MTTAELQRYLPLIVAWLAERRREVEEQQQRGSKVAEAAG
jgi:hypothetical protein